MTSERITDRLTEYTLTPAELAQAALEYVQRKTGKEATQADLRDWYLRTRVRMHVVVVTQ